MTLVHQTPTLPRASFSGKVCVSVYGRTVGELGKNVKQAQVFQPGFVELRLDYITGISDKIDQIGKIRKYPNEIYTFRSRAEGGVSRVSTTSRKGILADIISTISPPLMDMEIKTLDESPEIDDLLKKNNSDINLIVSSHNFQGLESTPQLEDLVLNAARRYSPSFVKIVRTANEFQDNLTMLSLYRLAARIAPARLISFCAGPLGLFSRIACVSCGSPFTFASLPGKSTASGQLDARSMTVLMESWKMGSQ